MKSADKFSNVSMYGVFMITLTNFLISAFSGTNTKVPEGAPIDEHAAMEQSAPEV